MRAQSFDLDTPLIDFSNGSQSCKWTIRDSVEGVAIFGGIGSGKTSGSAKKIALKYLSAGYGGLILACKRQEKNQFIQYCKETNRLADLCIIEPGGQEYFNVLEYEASQKIGDISLTENVAHLLKVVIKASEEKSSGKSDDPFWENSLDQVVSNVIDLSILAYNNVTVKKMYDILTTVPISNQKVEEPSKAGSYAHAFGLAAEKISKLFDAFVRQSSHLKEDELESLFVEQYPEAATLKAVDHFFIEQYRALSDKTRSIISMSFSGLLFRLMKEPVYSLFSKNSSTVGPEDCFNGKIVLINLPVKVYHKIGRDSQLLVKYAFQRGFERRDITVNDRPVFLFADEAQVFLNEFDPDFQATARENRIATVYISQNLPNYYANMGGNKYEHRVKAFLGTLGTQIFHANSDVETNRYASDLIGEAYSKEEGKSTNIGEQIGFNYSESYRLNKLVRPEDFVKLKSGGPRNDMIVEAYIHCQSLAFPSGFHHQKVIFKQA